MIIASCCILLTNLLILIIVFLQKHAEHAWNKSHHCEQQNLVQIYVCAWSAICSATRPSGHRFPEGDLFKTEGPQKEVEGIEHDEDDDEDEDEDDNNHQVSFVGEPGLDMGGLTKEWFQVPKMFYHNILCDFFL